MERKYILFDLDGTLTDPMMGITKSVRYALNYYGINVDSLNDLLPYIGPPLRDSFKEFYGFDDDKANEAVNKYREYFATEGIFDNKVYEGIPECLQKLKDAGKILLVATSKPEKFAKQIIEYFDLDKYFDFIGGSEFNGREKKADVIKYVLKANHIDASKAIMVGDRRYDIIGAHENDLPCVGVLYGYGSLEELKGNRADYLADTIIELTSLLLEL
ncbi:phosphoglycolate phosphatase [Thomasclavelia cocleata]|uniref:Phosphoglycolate phosphatase n=1 Tax=Thomasclavelia cocleata TaxID=69824 RepID=A0A1I0EXI4_9FIRM|nr:HAD-IA family hydrolase [Thomasclavelia cocleata]MCR1960369.1 HAD-IA family hydrolase [Thomasclavelia cocleata]NDO42888.1 HAD-IA family hydrolase [Thomasclavelia cocleata]PJN80631.1 phosphoglycolate phosphatase [Thomasclavelia cocleata]SET50229.1 phosphoglycolate phosphatase [Thomasclavelia cocleata]